uniref:Uncharacterized protein n=1 Tax=Romanomermis culicivorax TaxID=13658 RepID=A0A915JDP2_ROMCU
MARVEEELMRSSLEMARQAKIEATIGGSVKGHQTLERQRPTMPPKTVHWMGETLNKIRWKSKPSGKSNLVDMNLDDFYEDPPAQLYDDRYSSQDHKISCKRQRKRREVRRMQPGPSTPDVKKTNEELGKESFLAILSKEWPQMVQKRNQLIVAPNPVNIWKNWKTAEL